MSGANILSGKVALVTGASSGLGRHFAQSLASWGAAVAVAARRTDALSPLAAELRARGAGALPVALDVSNNASIDAAVAAAERELGPIDVLVNNSGLAIPAPVLEESAESWDRTLDTNLRGAFFMAQAVAKRMRDRKRGGSIINIASIAGLRQTTRLTSYAASKAALIQITQTMALELARYDIRVNAIAPGYICTDLNKDFWPTPAGEAVIKRIPQRRLGRAEDLDGVLQLLSSDASRYMTGVVIPVDGGHLVSGL